MSQIKGGKKPLSAKKPTNPIDPGLGDALYIPPAVVAKAKKEGFLLRWLDYKTLVENHGYHKTGWQPCQKGEFGEFNTANLFGESPDKLERRGSVVLGKRSIEVSEWKKAQVKEKTARQAGLARTHKQELAASARSAGIETIIDTAYEE